jgi:hypothetical protein
VVTRPHAGDIQALGHDLNLLHWVTGRGWTDLRAGAPTDPALRRLEDFIIYGRPFYALDDGEVLGCWRNAPDNPAVDAVDPSTPTSRTVASTMRSCSARSRHPGGPTARV